MKKILLILICPFLLFGCQSDIDDGRIKVYTSFYTMYDFAQKIAGDNVRVYNLMPQGTDAHDWQPSSKQIVNLNKADIFIYNGLGMEHWVESVIPTLENPKLKVVIASDGVTVIGGEHEEENEEEEHNHGAVDPHIWLSPINAEIILSNIKDALIEVDPDNALEYQSNYDKYAEECKQLHNDFTTQLENFEKRDIVVTHQAFSYLCEEYNLNQFALQGLHSEETNPQRMKEAADYIKAENIKVIFYEPASGKALAQTLSNEDGVSTSIAPLNPLESLTDEEIKNKADYFSVMRANLAEILKALKKQNGII